MYTFAEGQSAHKLVKTLADIMTIIQVSPESKVYPILGKPVSTKTDEFPENFRTAFAPPPRPFFGKFHCDFFRKFITKITVSNAKKIAMKFFRSEMTPPPPFGNFPEIHSNPGTQASLSGKTEINNWILGASIIF